MIRYNGDVESKHQSFTPQRSNKHCMEPAIAEKIPILRQSQILDPRYTERIIYESYKPANLKQMQDYMDFIIGFRSILPSQIINKTNYKRVVDEILNSNDLSEDIRNYYSTETKTKLPECIDQSKILIFDSNFESGNLDRVSIVSLNEYDLFLNVDTNTKGHCLWFYFAVTNVQKDETIKFNILNCSRSTHLYKSQMKPLVFSEMDLENNGIEWVADTFNASYGKSSENKYFLSFSYKFKYSGDRVYFAYARPYTITMYFNMLREIKVKLLNKAKNIVTLEENGLHKRIEAFISAKGQKSGVRLETEKISSEEDQLQNKYTRKKQTLFPEHNLATEEVLKKYRDNGNKRFAWLRALDYQINTEDFIYRQETLCRSFGGFPIELITITSHPHVS